MKGLIPLILIICALGKEVLSSNLSPAWEDGKQYTYKVYTQVNAPDKLELSYELILTPVGQNVVHFKVEHLRVNDENGHSHSHANISEFIKNFETPSLVQVEKGVVVSLQADSNLPVWVLNMKRLHASYFVLNLNLGANGISNIKGTHRYDAKESSVDGGSCITKYLVWNGSTNFDQYDGSDENVTSLCPPQAQHYKLTKTLNLGQCDDNGVTNKVGVKTRIYFCAQDNSSAFTILNVERISLRADKQSGETSTTLSLVSVRPRSRLSPLESINNPKIFQLPCVGHEEDCSLKYTLLRFLRHENVTRRTTLKQNPPQDEESVLQDRFLRMFSPATAVTPRMMPDLSEVAKHCPRDSFFYSLAPEHMEAVKDLKFILEERYKSGGALGCQNLMWALRDDARVNPKVWYQAVESISLHYPSFERIRRPSPLEAMPENFIDSRIIEKARAQQQRQNSGPTGHLKQQQWGCVVADETFGADNGFENALWYYREDIMLNVHHWYFHLTYPAMNVPNSLSADRRGEMFYYFHHSMLARYNAERFSNGLPRTQEFNLDAHPSSLFIDQGYNSHLSQGVNARRGWTDRAPWVRFSDTGLPGGGTEVNQVITSRQRILNAINNGALFHQNGMRISLIQPPGIDMVGNVVEASDRAVNPEFYVLSQIGGLHNIGHGIIGSAMDPTGQLNLPSGVMLDTSTSMRDPIFYKWHTAVNSIFMRYKATLQSYGRSPQPTNDFTLGDQLILPGVNIQQVQVWSAWRYGATPGPNILETFWNYRQFRLTQGMDFTRPTPNDPTPPVAPVICDKHLDHSEFNYQIIIDKTGWTAQRVTLRIFMAPKYKENGQPWSSIEEQQPFFFVMDTWKAVLTPGRNYIQRSSVDTPLTKPWTEALNNANMGGQEIPYCGCGWPHHLLLPKGTRQGMTYDLFVMVTDATADEEGVVDPNAQPESCRSAWLMCGIGNRLYPDRKPMGYPFDRPIRTALPLQIEHWVNGVPNMATTQVRVLFTGTD